MGVGGAALVGVRVGDATLTVPLSASGSRRVGSGAATSPSPSSRTGKNTTVAVGGVKGDGDW